MVSASGSVIVVIKKQYFTLSLHEKSASLRHPCSKGRYVFSWGGRAGASEGRVNSESEHQKGRAIPQVSYSREGYTSFPEFFNENFCDVAFHFSYGLSFSFHQL